MASDAILPGPTTVFQELRLPELATPAGCAALTSAFNLKVPLPLTLSAITTRHKPVLADGWRLHVPPRAPAETFNGHLTFALKHKGVNVLVLKRLFWLITPSRNEELVWTMPTGRYNRRVWFLYEWLLSTPLDLPDAAQTGDADALDAEL